MGKTVEELKEMINNTITTNGRGQITGQGLNQVLNEMSDSLSKIGSDVLPTATSEGIGGIKIGYEENNKNYPVQLETDSKAFVNIPWTDTKNTTGSGAGSGKMFLIGAKEQNHSGVSTFSDSQCYISNGVLYSNSAEVLNKNTTITNYLQNIPSTLQSTHAIHYTKIGNNQFDGLIKPASPCSIYEFEYSSLVNGLVVNLKESTRQTDNIYDVSGLQTMPFTQNIKIYMSVDAYRSLIVDGGGSLYFEPDAGYVSDIKYFYNIYRLSDRVIPTQRQSGLYTGDLSKMSHTILDVTCYYGCDQDKWQVLVEQNIFLLTSS